MAGAQNSKWYTGSVLPYIESSGIWDRDNALFTLAWRAKGMDSKFIALGEAGSEGGRPLILTTREKMADAKWWRSLEIEGVVFTTWGWPKYEPISRAIKQSGTKLILIMDADGLFAPRVWFEGYLYKKYAMEKDEGRPLAFFSAWAKTLVTLNKRHWRPAVDHVGHADIIAVQSPLAVEFFRRYVAVNGRPDLQDRVVFVPHAVTDDVRGDAAVAKQKEIITVGRWDSFQKNAPLLIDTLRRFFERDDEYSAQIIGKGEAVLHALISKLPQEVRSRFNVVGPVPHAQLTARYNRAQIFLSTSRFESFGIAAAEALCCGCSVVGPGFIPAFHYFSSQASGSVAHSRGAQSFADALAVEVRAWKNNERNAQSISHFFCDKVHASKVAHSLLELGRKIASPT